MSSSSDSIFGITAAVVAVPTGATNAIVIGGGGYARTTNLKVFAGTTGVVLFGLINGVTNPFGATMSGSSMVAGMSTGYALSANENLQFVGAPQMWAVAIGSTQLLTVMQGLSNNTSTFNPS